MLAAELVETSRLFARCAAKIEPEWIEAVAGDRVDARLLRAALGRRARRGRRERARAALRAHARAAPPRVVSAASIPRVAREVFIREALVPGALATKGAFLAHNRRLVAEVAELEHKARRQDVLVDDEAIAAFYAERVPAGRPLARRRSSAGARTPSAAIRGCCSSRATR